MFRTKAPDRRRPPWSGGAAKRRAAAEPMNKRDLAERDICTKLITPALRRAGWDETQICEEVSFTKGRITVLGKLVICGARHRLPRIRNLLSMTGAESHPELPAGLAACRLPRRLPWIGALNHYIGDVSDHLPFRRAGLSYLFFSCGRWEHYHQPSDTPQRFNCHKMRRIARFLTGLLGQLGALTLAAAEPADTTAFELSALRAALGPWLTVVRRALKLGKIETCAYLDRLAAVLLRTGQ